MRKVNAQTVNHHLPHPPLGQSTPSPFLLSNISQYWRRGKKGNVRVTRRKERLKG